MVQAAWLGAWHKVVLCMLRSVSGLPAGHRFMRGAPRCCQQVTRQDRSLQSLQAGLSMRACGGQCSPSIQVLLDGCGCVSAPHVTQHACAASMHAEAGVPCTGTFLPAATHLEACCLYHSSPPSRLSWAPRCRLMRLAESSTSFFSTTCAGGQQVCWLGLLCATGAQYNSPNKSPATCNTVCATPCFSPAQVSRGFPCAGSAGLMCGEIVPDKSPAAAKPFVHGHASPGRLPPA